MKTQIVHVTRGFGIAFILFVSTVTSSLATEYTLSVSPATRTVAEGEEAVFTLVTDQTLPLLCALSVSYHLNDQTATMGDDYNDAGSGLFSFTFMGGDIEITVPTIDDSVDEDDEDFDLIVDSASLMGPACMGDSITIDSAGSTGTAIIEDDDFTLTFSSTGAGSITVGDTVGTPAATPGPGADEVMIDVDTTQEFEIEVNSEMLELYVDGVAQGSPWTDRDAGTYTYSFSTTDPDSSHTLEAAFEGNPEIVIIDDPVYGEISFQGSSTLNKDGNRVVEVPAGSDITFTISAVNPCPLGLDHNNHRHHISSIKVDDSALPDVQGQELTTYIYTFTNVTESHTLEAAFTRYVDVTIHGAGQVVTPTITNTGSGLVQESVELEYLADHTFSMIPAPGHSIQKLLIDGAEYGMPESYTFSEVDADHSLDIFYQVSGFVLEAISHYGTIYLDAGETIPATTQTVDSGSTTTLYIDIDNPDHAVVGILIDNLSVRIPDPGEVMNYINGITLENHGDDYVSVEFADINASHRLESLDHDTVDISDIPLDAKLRPNPPSIMFVLDDSGSMDWEFATDDGL